MLAQNCRHLGRVCITIEFSHKRGPKKVLHILPPNIWILGAICFVFLGHLDFILFNFISWKNANRIKLYNSKIVFFNGPNQIISLSEKIFFQFFCLHKISKLGPDSNIEKNSKHWRQYMQNFLSTPLVREFYRNADSSIVLHQQGQNIALIVVVSWFRQKILMLSNPFFTKNFYQFMNKQFEVVPIHIFTNLVQHKPISDV